MPGDAAWIALGALALCTELVAVRLPHRVAPLGRWIAPLARTAAGRALLLAGWAFIGLHLFARAGIAHL
ncbi:MAG TPA: DUF6186 family protein [Acidimicrobiales bacterium]|nr:DUF6186 family protein [Acidimicrobiales bacterium]